MAKKLVREERRKRVQNAKENDERERVNVFKGLCTASFPSRLFTFITFQTFEI